MCTRFHSPGAGPLIRRWSILLLATLALADTPGKPATAPAGPFLRSPRVFHHPKDVLLKGYPYDIDLIVDFPADSVQSVLLFLKIDARPNYREIQVPIVRERFRYHYDPRVLPADSIEYFFVVTIKGNSIFAAPLDKTGLLQPVKRTFIDPQEYFRNRDLFKK